MKTIYTSVISRHQGHWAMFTAFQQAAGYALQHGYRPLLAPHVGDSLVSRARNNCIGQFLESDAEYLFTLDDDIALPEHALVTLADAGKEMIGGFYRLKQSTAGKDNIRDMIAFRMKEDFNLGQEEPTEVQYISSGCVMHTREFIEKMIEEYPELHYVENITGKDRYALYQPYIYKEEYLSEDWAFCQRALDKGHKLYMHPKVLCDHWGLYKYDFNEIMDKFKEKDKE